MEARVAEGAEAMRALDIDGMLSLYHPDVVLVPQRAAIMGEYRGHDGLRRFVTDTLESFEVFDPRMSEIRALDDRRVLGIGVIRVRGRGSGVDTEVPMAAIFTLTDDGRLLRFEDHAYREHALRAVGLG
jgi:ketosteroid isomerase-like protein